MLLSVAESQCYAVVMESAEGLGTQSLSDLGLKAEVRTWTDSHAARAIPSKKCSERRRRIELRYLRVQEITNSGRVKIIQAPSGFFSGDHMTKGKAWCDIEKLIRRVGRR